MDPRYNELAQQLIRYSTSLKKGEKILLDLVDTPEAMAIALIREVRARKGVPFLRLGANRLTRELMIGATNEQFKTTGKHLLAEIGTIVSWQFRYVETESVYWRDRPLEEITEWQRQNGSLAPILGNEGALEFSPQKGQQAISVKTWPVSGGEKK